MGTYGRFENILSENTAVQNQKLPEKILKIIKPTKGYLLFKEQGMELYSEITGANSGEAYKWVENWNKKEQMTRLQHILRSADGIEIDLFSLFVKEEMGSFFLNKPISESFILLRELNPSYQDKFKTEGIFLARFHGDLVDEIKEKESIQSKAELIETNNGLVRLRLKVEFKKLKIRESWEFGLNFQFQNYPWVDYVGLEVIELDESDYLIQLYPFRSVLRQDIYDDFSLKIRFKNAQRFTFLSNCNQNHVFDLKFNSI
ncbi:hypothetical protein [Algoriphagus taiwanensis]